jgi:ribosome biogenesis GTPase A
MVRLRAHCPEKVLERYKFEPTEEMTGFDMLETAARKRGFLISGGECDLERMAAVLLDEFRGGKLGRITLEAPPEEPSNEEGV